ncbi:MAG: hypothetical protein ACMXYG_05970 [Candidatus Woesearchaeota archaeon]
MPTRTTQELSLKMTHILPNFIYGLGAKHHIRDIKKEFQALNDAMKQLKDADDDVNIDAVLAAINKFFKEEENAENHIMHVDEDVSVLEFRALEILDNFHDAFNKVISKVQLPPDLAKELQKIPEKYNQWIPILQRKVEEMAQQVRREKIGREMLKDFMIQELVAIYFQMRLRAKDLRRQSSRIRDAEKSLEKNLNRLKKHADSKDVRRIVNIFEKRFVVALENILADAIFVERMLLKIRDRLESLDEREQQQMKNLLASGFPQDKIDKINKDIVDKLHKKVHDDVLKQYQECRVMEHLVDEAKGLKNVA